MPIVRQILQTLAHGAIAGVNQPDELWVKFARRAAIVDRCAYHRFCALESQGHLLIYTFWELIFILPKSDCLSRVRFMKSKIDKIRQVDIKFINIKNGYHSPQA